MSEIDIVIYGATGFTGKLVAEYYAETIAGSDITFGLAGRNIEKLKDVKEHLIKINDACIDVPLIIADVNNIKSLDEMTAQAKVLITTVGPYAKYGEAVVEACIRNNCDYCDLTGEVQFMKRCIDKYNKVAEVKGVAIVHACGFDSIPSDMAALFVTDYFQTKHQQKTKDVHYYVMKSKGYISGGTLASGVNAITSLSSKERKEIGRAGCLVPPDSSYKPKERDLTWPKYDKVLDSWTNIWMMEACNTRVVRRSAALLDYGNDFAYTEVMKASSAFVAYLTNIVIILAIILLVIPPTRWLLQKFVLPAPGQGPTLDQRLNGYWNGKIIAFSKPNNNQSQRRIVVKISGKRDPGYGSTSRMLGEAALCLLSRKQADASICGVLTPASAMGMALLPGLQRAGVTINVVADDVALMQD